MATARILGIVARFSAASVHGGQERVVTLAAIVAAVLIVPSAFGQASRLSDEELRSWIHDQWRQAEALPRTFQGRVEIERKGVGSYVDGQEQIPYAERLHLVCQGEVFVRVHTNRLGKLGTTLMDAAHNGSTGWYAAGERVGVAEGGAWDDRTGLFSPDLRVQSGWNALRTVAFGCLGCFPFEPDLAATITRPSPEIAEFQYSTPTGLVQRYTLDLAAQTPRISQILTIDGPLDSIRGARTRFEPSKAGHGMLPSLSEAIAYSPSGRVYERTSFVSAGPLGPGESIASFVAVPGDGKPDPFRGVWKLPHAGSLPGRGVTMLVGEGQALGNDVVMQRNSSGWRTWVTLTIAATVAISIGIWAGRSNFTLARLIRRQ